MMMLRRASPLDTCCTLTPKHFYDDIPDSKFLSSNTSSKSLFNQFTANFVSIQTIACEEPGFHTVHNRGTASTSDVKSNPNSIALCQERVRKKPSLPTGNGPNKTGLVHRNIQGTAPMPLIESAPISIALCQDTVREEGKRYDT